MSLKLKSQPSAAPDQAIAKLISRHYGDGGIYLPRAGARGDTLNHAIHAGFVSDDGFITQKGRRLLARTEF